MSIYGHNLHIFYAILERGAKVIFVLYKLRVGPIQTSKFNQMFKMVITALLLTVCVINRCFIFICLEKYNERKIKI